MGEKEKKKRSYYHDEDNDLTEYSEGNEGFYACWVNPHLTLLFPHDCTEQIPKDIIGFQIHGIRHILHKAEEQAKIPLTPEQKEHMERIFKEAGFELSLDNDGDET